MEFNKLSIKDWAQADRPREKLLEKGRETLTDAELMAILLGSGNRDESAVALSQRILASVKNNLNELGRLTIKDLTQFKGIGEAKAITVIAALELGRRRKQADVQQRMKITGSKDVAALLQPSMADLPHEELWVIYLNSANKIIEKRRLAQGGLNSATMDARLILKGALDCLAANIILCHNHPSGNTKPSQSDIESTRRIEAAAQLMLIKVLDHVIVTSEGYYSFADQGLMTG